MGMPSSAPPQRWTAQMVRDLTPEDYNSWPRYECIDGELLVSAAPVSRHQQAIVELLALLHPYVREHRLGETLPGPADIELDPYTLVQPDLFVSPLIEGRRIRSWSEVRTLRLAVEVLSPSTARYDRVTKRNYYRKFGVPEYWVVDVHARAVERSRPDESLLELLSETLVWQPDPAIAPLVIDLPAYFAEVWGETA